jgi:membrane protease YdiL (CAAX protease family)
MGQFTTNDILLGIFTWMVLTILFGSLMSWIWTIRRLLNGRSVLPETPLVERGRTPWGAGTILLVVVAFVVVNVGAFSGYTLATRGRPPGKPADAPHRVDKKEAGKLGPAEAVGEPGAAGPPRLAAAAGADRPRDSSSVPGEVSLPELMFVQAVINSLLIVLLPLILRMTSGARLRDLGLSLAGWRRQVAVGTVALLLLLPIVYTVQFACVKYLDVPRPEDRAHPVEKMLREELTGGLAYLAVLTAVILAPILEELLFRGIIQSWLIKAMNDLNLRLVRLRAPSQPLDPNIPVDGYWAVDEVVETDLGQVDASPRASEHSEDPSKPSDQPDIVDSPSFTGAAIVLTSLVFASLHAPQWPAPIPLFVLSVGLGVVYHRTGSLLAVICMHALFNGLPTLAILLSPGKEKPVERPLIERVAPLGRAELQVPVVDRRLRGGNS